MAPMFGKRDDGQDDVAAMSAELGRISALTLPELAAEVMTKAFGPNGPGGPGQPGTLEAPSLSAGRVSMNRIASAVCPAVGGRGVGSDQQLRLWQLIAEGLQILENASLVRVTWNGGQDDYFATRLGRASLERDALKTMLPGFIDLKE